MRSETIFSKKEREGSAMLDINERNPSEGSSLSRRMFLKIGGWLVMAAGMLRIPGIALAQGKPDVIAENVRFPGRMERWAGIWRGPPGKGPFRASS